ncbi:Mandelate racemase / muconate lactonizing enzyme, N-terminal domain [Musa troglodytarum]|uniref:Mandelate racemase / muconate lactonizing enzyme, N-terminal domain n=1 Tax=Musa troglodytarum TaxID=320322 RepID=A0A9E7JHC7_9LILI|nr:Mandelate racemase / muconate lactonizing enzyme, N-terminal domain [Musa troglodytarum]
MIDSKKFVCDIHEREAALATEKSIVVGSSTQMTTPLCSSIRAAQVHFLLSQLIGSSAAQEPRKNHDGTDAQTVCSIWPSLSAVQVTCALLGHAMDPLCSSTLSSYAQTLLSSSPLVSTKHRNKTTPRPHAPRVPHRELFIFRCADASTRRPQPAVAMSFGFESLKETLTIDVGRAEGRPLDVPLARPFTIASSRLDRVGNVAIRVELHNGSVGWGEAPVLPSVTAEDQSSALAAAADACPVLVRSPPMTLGAVLAEVGRVLPGHDLASVRAGFEMALIDAAANSIRIPLWRLFGGASNSITTDITIPIVSPSEAAELAAKYCRQGFSTLKLKVGKDLNSDIEVLRAIRSVHPDCSFILDANEGYKSHQAIEVLDKLHVMGVTPILFEQPVHRDDWEGLHVVSHIAKDKYGVSVAADESCRSITDAHKIIQGNLAHVINIKLAKLGVIGALEIINIAREAGVTLMIGGMVETRLAMGFSGHLAAGLGCFSFIDLDTPLLLSEDPVIGGYEVQQFQRPWWFSSLGQYLMKLKLLVVQCAAARSSTGGGVRSFNIRQRRRPAKKLYVFSKFRRLLRRGVCNEDEQPSLKESKGMMKQRLLDLFASSQSVEDEGGSNSSGGDNGRAVEALMARRGGGAWRFRSAAGLRCRLLRRAWRPVLVAIPESD